MILNFDKFKGKVKSDNLEKEEVIELVSLITNMRPSLPELFPEENISKLIDNINHYTSEDGKYNISVYFRESDIYHNEDGTITHGKFKSLFKITIRKQDSELKISDLKDYIVLTSDIIKNVYPESRLLVKIEDKRLSIDDFRLINDENTIDKLVLVVRIL